MPATPKTSIDSEQPLHKLTSLIWNECSDYVKAYRETGHVLYRGIGRGATAPPIFKSTPRTDRTPMTSSPLLQEIYDNYLQRKGIVAGRQNSIFTTASREQADGYVAGESGLYIIIPCNGTPYSWSLHQDDIILDNSGLLNPKIVREIALDVRDHANLGKQIPAFWKKHGAKPNGDIDDATYAMTKVDFKTLMYDIAAAGLPVAKKLSLNMLANNNTIEEHFAPTNENFERALVSGHEVLIAGPYYGVSVAHSKALMFDLGIKITRSPVETEPDEQW